MAIILTREQALAEAETAYHRLLTGTAVAEVTDQNGEKVVYSKADQGKLLRYIEKLRLVGRPKGPMRAIF